ncbi:MAG: phage tail tape measure protein, partial [Pirellulales bacterium]
MAGDFNAGKVTVEIAVLDALTDDVKRMEKTLAGFGASTEKQASKLDRFQKKAASVGKSLTMKVSAPLIGAGAASFKMASDFEKSMTKITTLVGISATEVKAMEKDVLALSGKTAQAPKDLADAMFFIQSAGLRGAAATETLEASAKAAAVGLGEASTIADLATSALNAYGESNLSATQATDVMVAAVREGKLESEELAGSMGRVLPIASAMGVSFDEVGASFAALSRTGTNAAEAATQVRGIMSSLLRPTKQAEEALTEMGLSSEGLRKQMREEGLLSSLETLSEKFAGNEAAAASVFGNIRALSGVMDLMGENVETTRQIFENMTDTTGMLDEAFAGTADTASFKLGQAMAEFKKSMIVLGQQVLPVIIPIIEDIGKFIGRAAEAFNNLSPGIKKAIVIIGGLVAVVGPALIALSSMITAVKALKAALMGAHPAFLIVGAAIAVIGIALAKRSQDAANFKKEVEKTQDVLMSINPEIEGVTSRLEALADTLPDAADPMGELAEKAREVGTESLYAAKVTGTDLYKSFRKVRDAGVEVEKVLVDDISKLDKFITEVDRGNGITNAAMNEIKGMSKEGPQLARELADLHDAEEITIKDMRELVEDIEQVNSALEEATRQSKSTADEFLKSEDTYKIITQQLGFTSAAADDLHNELLQMAKDADDPRVALQKLEQTVEEVADAHAFAAAEFGDYREEAKAVAQDNTMVLETWEQLKDAADARALFFTLALDTTGLYEQLNDAMNAIIDLGSMMPGGDSAALDTQLALSRRISEKLIDTRKTETKAANDAATSAAKAAEAAHKAAMAEAERAFNKFVNDAVGLGGRAISESFVSAIAGDPDDIKKAFKELFDTAFRSGLTQIPELRSTFQKALEGQQALIAIAEKRANLNNVLEHSEEKLATALEHQAAAQAKVNRLVASRADLASKTASAFGFKFDEDIGAKAQAERLLEQYTT